jgi:hypothetical protein
VVQDVLLVFLGSGTRQLLAKGLLPELGHVTSPFTISGRASVHAIVVVMALDKV